MPSVKNGQLPQWFSLGVVKLSYNRANIRFVHNGELQKVGEDLRDNAVRLENASFTLKQILEVRSMDLSLKLCDYIGMSRLFSESRRTENECDLRSDGRTKTI